jgi:hypothetical protein
MTMSQLSQPSASISARDMGRKGTGPDLTARCVLYEKSGFGVSSAVAAKADA